MGWFFRKSWRLLPGIRISLSKSGPRLSFGVPGARASVGMDGKTRVYAGKGPVRFQKTIGFGSKRVSGEKLSVLSLIKRLFSGRSA